MYEQDDWYCTSTKLDPVADPAVARGVSQSHVVPMLHGTFWLWPADTNWNAPVATDVAVQIDRPSHQQIGLTYRRTTSTTPSTQIHLARARRGRPLRVLSAHVDWLRDSPRAERAAVALRLDGLYSTDLADVRLAPTPSPTGPQRCATCVPVAAAEPLLLPVTPSPTGQRCACGWTCVPVAVAEPPLLPVRTPVPRCPV